MKKQLGIAKEAVEKGIEPITSFGWGGDRESQHSWSNDNEGSLLSV